MAKSPDAFRTISEVAEWLGIQAHVLRFWESKFTQVKPVKRAGGRRYYRPGDMLLLGGIKKLLYEDGLTIKGVQKILREEGMSHVADMSPPLDELTLSELDETLAPSTPEVSVATPEPEEPRGVVLNFENAPAEAPPAAAPEPEPAPPVAEEAAPADPPQPPSAPKPEAAPAAENTALPAFLRRPAAPEAETPAEPAQPEAPPAAEPEPPAPPPAPKPRQIDMPPLTPEHEIIAEPALLSAAYRTKRLDAKAAAAVAPLLDRLASHRDQMASQRRTAPGS